MHVIKVPYGVGSLGKNNQTKCAPDKIQEATKEIFLSELENIPVFKFDNIDLDESNMEQAHELIEQQSLQFLKNATQPLCFVGGDHSITYSTFKAFAQTQPKDENNVSKAGLIVIDAHPDLMQSFNPPTHENYLRCLIEDNIINPKNIILIAIRAQDKEESQFIKKHNINCFSMNEIANESWKETCFAIMAKARDFTSAYFSIDIDGVDPAYAPGTGYQEPGGISSRDLIHLIHKLRLLNNIKCYDVVEINPEKDINNTTVKLGARILAELA